jgi:hypothetical protein
MVLVLSQVSGFTKEDPEHLVPATILRHRHLKPSTTLGSAYQVISRPQELHCTLVRINPTSFRNWIPVAWSLNRNVRKFLFASPEYPSESRRKDVLGTYGISRSLSWYSLTTLVIWFTIFIRICDSLLHTVAPAWKHNGELVLAVKTGLLYSKKLRGKKPKTSCHQCRRSINKFWDKLPKTISHLCLRSSKFFWVVQPCGEKAVKPWLHYNKKLRRKTS